MLWSQRIHRNKQGRDELGALQELTVKTWPGFVDWDTGVECRVSGEQMWAWLDLLQLQTEVCQRWTRAPAVARGSLGVCSRVVHWWSLPDLGCFLQFDSNNHRTGWREERISFEKQGIWWVSISVLFYSFLNIPEWWWRDHISLPQEPGTALWSQLEWGSACSKVWRCAGCPREAGLQDYS